MIMNPKQKAIEWIKSRVPFSSGYYEDDKEDIINKALDIALKEERGRIIKLIMSQPCNTPQMATTQRKIIDLICK